MLNALIPLLGSVLDRIIPDPATAADAKLKAFELAQKGELAVLDADVRLALGQIEVNKVEAAAQDAFATRWRPAAGWVCVAGLFYEFLVRPMLPWLIAVIFQIEVPALPWIDKESLMMLLTGLLGLGGFRTVERLRGKV